MTEVGFIAQDSYPKVHLTVEKQTNRKPSGQSAKPSGQKSDSFRNLPDACAIIGVCKCLYKTTFSTFPRPSPPHPALYFKLRTFIAHFAESPLNATFVHTYYNPRPPSNNKINNKKYIYMYIYVFISLCIHVFIHIFIHMFSR